MQCVLLYTCPSGTAFGDAPGPFAHPCGKAAKALDRAGHAYELKQVKGGLMRFWTLPTRARDRAEIERLSGQRGVPILVLDDGSVITGSGAIVKWAQNNSPSASAGESG